MTSLASVGAQEILRKSCSHCFGDPLLAQFRLRAESCRKGLLDLARCWEYIVQVIDRHSQGPSIPWKMDALAL